MSEERHAWKAGRNLMKVADYPAKIRPYVFHGVRFNVPKAGEWLAQVCPFCDRENKFSVNEATGQWKCWSCASGSDRGGGNTYSFLREVHDLSIMATKVEDYVAFSSERGYMDSQPLIEWGLCKSVFNQDWLVPGYNPQGQLTSLYRYMRQPEGGYRLIPTPTLGHHIHGMNLWDSSKPLVYLCEGPWDGMMLWECMTRGKNSEERGICPTASRESSLYAQANIIATPGCEVFFDNWTALFSGKIVNIMFDSDHPRKHPKSGKITNGAGWRGAERVTGILSKSKTPPQEINVLTWGEDGYDPKHKSGFDVRDFILSE